MKRRGFLGFLGGAAVAGPSMVKQAAAASMADLSLVNMGLAAAPIGNGVPLPGGGSTDWAAGSLAKLVGRSAAEHMRRRKTVHVQGLHPDIAALRSTSLAFKVRKQQERDYWLGLENERSWLERVIAGED